MWYFGGLGPPYFFSETKLEKIISILFYLEYELGQLVECHFFFFFAFNKVSYLLLKIILYVFKCIRNRFNYNF